MRSQARRLPPVTQPAPWAGFEPFGIEIVTEEEFEELKAHMTQPAKHLPEFSPVILYATGAFLLIGVVVTGVYIWMAAL